MTFSFSVCYYKYLFFLEIFGYTEKWFDKKTMLNFKICDVIYWAKNNCNKDITQYLKKPKPKPFQAMKFDHWVKNSLRNIFL